MKRIKYILLVSALLVISHAGLAQKQTFDVVTFDIPGGWQQKQNDDAVQLSITDGKTGAYAMVIVTRAMPSTASATENFNNQWTAAIKNQVQLDGEPSMQPSSNGNGWDIVTGSAGYTDNVGKGNVALLSATGAGKTVTVVVMTNSKQYENGLTAFLNSLTLSKAVSNETDNTVSGAKNSANNNTVVGLWTDYTTESSGMVNGFPQPTGGYTRREYNLKADGTYIFRHKYWSAYMKEILFIYEAGTWKTDGNQLVITPTSGRGEWWAKAASGKNNEWGGFKKASDYKGEAATYSFEFKYLKGMQQTYLILRSNKHVSRDGTTAETNNYEESFSPRGLDKSLIGNPPGF